MLFVVDITQAGGEQSLVFGSHSAISFSILLRQ
jgi:hypothetical protein